MTELKAYVCGGWCCDKEAYPKDEADKVIAELKDDVTYWKKVAKKNMDDNVAMARERAKAFESEHRHKYKRCLAMANTLTWEHNYLVDFVSSDFPNVRFKRKHRIRWIKKWLALAEKFKEAK